MSDELNEVMKDVGEDLLKLSEATADALVEDVKDILEDAKESSPRVKELAKEALDWQVRFLREDDEELKSRYQAEYNVAAAAVATRLVDEKRVADTAAREKFQERLDAFKDGLLEIGKMALKTGGKVALNNFTGGIGGELVGPIIDKL